MLTFSSCLFNRKKYETHQFFRGLCEDGTLSHTPEAESLQYWGGKSKGVKTLST